MLNGPKWQTCHDVAEDTEWSQSHHCSQDQNRNNKMLSGLGQSQPQEFWRCNTCGNGNHSLLDLVPRKIYHRQTRHSNCSYCDRRQQFEGLSPIHCHCGRYLGGACHSQLEGSLNYFANVTFPPMSLAIDFGYVTFDLHPSYWLLNIWHIFNFGWIFAAPQIFFEERCGPRTVTVMERHKT